MTNNNKKRILLKFDRNTVRTLTSAQSARVGGGCYTESQLANSCTVGTYNCKTTGTKIGCVCS
jgi:hypothetical protein